MPALKKKKQEEQQEEKQVSPSETVEGGQPVIGDEIQTNDHGSDTENLPAATQGTAVQTEETEEVDAAEYEAWLNDDDDEGSAIPFLNIEQKDASSLGMLVCEDLDEQHSEMCVVLLKAQSGCIMWKKPYKKGQDPLCKSDDGINPIIPDGGQPFCDQPNACLGEWKRVDGKNVKTKPCPYGNWEDGEKPPCDEIMKLLILEIGEGTMIPYWLTVKGFGMTEYNGLNKRLGMKVRALKGKLARKGQKGAKKCLFSFVLSTKKKEHDAGDHYIPSFSEIEQIHDDLKSDIMAFAFQAQQMSVATQHEIEEHEASGE